MAAGGPILGLIPQCATTYTYGETAVGTFNSDDETIIPVATFARPAAVIGDGRGVTVATSKVSGNLWICYDGDDAPYLGSFLYEINATSGAVVRKVQVVRETLIPNAEFGPIFPKLAEERGYHALFDLGCDKLLSVNRRTGDLLRLKLKKGETSTDLWKAVFDHKYRLNLAPFDGAVNVDGTRLMYIQSGAVKIWDLEKDVFFRTVLA